MTEVPLPAIDKEEVAGANDAGPQDIALLDRLPVPDPAFETNPSELNNVVWDIIGFPCNDDG
jgi:hypothetical protein